MPQTPFHPPLCPWPVRPADVPKPVMTVNNQKPDAHGNVNVTGTGTGDVRHSDFADMQTGGKMDLDTVNSKVDQLIMKLKGTASLAFALLSLSSFAALGPTTRFGAVHPDTTLREVVVAGGVPEKVSDLTNDVGYVTKAVTNGLASAGSLPTRVSDLTNDLGFVDKTVTNGLSAAVTNLAAKADAKLDDDFIALTNSVAFTNAVAHAIPPTDLSDYFTKDQSSTNATAKANAAIAAAGCVMTNEFGDTDVNSLVALSRGLSAVGDDGVVGTFLGSYFDSGSAEYYLPWQQKFSKGTRPDREFAILADIPDVSNVVRTNEDGDVEGGNISVGQWRLNDERGLEYNEDINITVGFDPDDGVLRMGEWRPNESEFKFFAHTDDIPDVSGFVPYTDATNDLDIGENALKAKAVYGTESVYLGDSAYGIGFAKRNGQYVLNTYNPAVDYYISLPQKNGTVALVSQIEAATNGLVKAQKWPLSSVTNAQGGAVSAADVGALPSGVDVDLGEHSLTAVGEAGFTKQSPDEFRVGWGDYATVIFSSGIMSVNASSFGYDDFSVSFPYGKTGTLAVESWSSLRTMLTDANTSTDADCQCIGSNICNLVRSTASFSNEVRKVASDAVFPALVPPFRETASYSPGAVAVGPDGSVYRCVSAATGAWDPAKWTKVGGGTGDSVSYSDFSSALFADASGGEAFRASVLATVVDLVRTDAAFSNALREVVAPETAWIADVRSRINGLDPSTSSVSSIIMVLKQLN